jgi:hypothetical protein
MTNKPDIIYEQNCQEFRSLNGFFWQIPLIMMTLNGGLWYSVASLDLAPMAQRGVLWFAAFANLVMIMGLWRLRSVMQDLLDAIHAYQGTQPPGRAKFIQYLFQVLLFWAAAGALIASIEPRKYFIRGAAKGAVQAATAADGADRAKRGASSTVVTKKAVAATGAATK